jgi:hypothetical protein
LLFFTLVDEMVLLLQLVVEEHEALIIYPEIKLVPILNEAELVLADAQLVSEEVPEVFLLMDDAAIAQDPLLACHDRVL